MTWADEARGPAVGQPLEAPPCCIEARGLRVAFRGAGEILRNVDLCVAPGEHVVVVGPSGCGKTTLLRCLMGEQRAAGGSVATRGRIATVYQDHRLVLQHSALRNVLYGCLGRRSALRTLARFPRDETAEARRLLRSVGLAHREQVAARRLSGGERQRVAIARAMMQRPAIILADEPVASLDRDNAVAIMRLLQELCARRDVALVSVLHDPSVVSAGAARLSYLSGGELHDGPPAAPARTALPPATTGGPTPDATDSKQAHSPPESVVRDPLLPRGAQFAFFALAALGIYGISVATLDIDERQLENVSVGLGRFFRDLLPESPAALLGLPWG
jgi:phosphonate transport system ATP-binding protein